ncbi:hypothetical protein [Streptomyces mutabilis]|uniref:hypothetical protein n=1 Tax=Streptomyces mutabilis TaxID=67332 RepID=UPI003418A9FD
MRYRRVWDNGSPKMQWRGVAARSSGERVVSIPLADGFRPQDRVPVTVARSAVGGANSLKVDFNADGTVDMVGGTTSPAASVTGHTTPADSTHTHGSHNHGISITNNGHTHGITLALNPPYDHYHGGNTTGTAVTTVGSTAGETNASSVHNHGGHNHSFHVSIDDPPWVSFEGIEYFVDWPRSRWGRKRWTLWTLQNSNWPGSKSRWTRSCRA